MAERLRIELRVGSVIIMARSIVPNNQKNRREINYPVSFKATGFFIMIWLNVAVLIATIIIFVKTITLGNKK